MTLIFDHAAYSNLLAEVAPKVIETEEEYDRALVRSLIAVGWVDARKPNIHSVQHQRHMQRSHFSIGEDSDRTQQLTAHLIEGIFSAIAHHRRLS